MRKQCKNRRLEGKMATKNEIYVKTMLKQSLWRKSEHIWHDGKNFPKRQC
jgi:hypothetical protein